VIQRENLRPGTSEWMIGSQGALHDEIEGFASPPSVNRGEDISFYVNTSESSYTLDIFRMGWYGGAGGRRMRRPIVRVGIRQPIPSPDAETGLIECQWSDPYVLRIPAPVDASRWASGIYLAKVTGRDSGRSRRIVFVVRDDTRPSDLLFQASFTTYQAYNEWGGRSLYSVPRAYKVSFRRPYKVDLGTADLGVGGGTYPFGWEYNAVRFLEREGYDVSYTSSLETHARGELLLFHKAFLSVGHDEYWSWEMRDNLEAARNAGVSLGFLGANAGYWQIRFEPSMFTNTANATMVCYKNAALDPLSGAPESRHLVTVRFRDPPVNRPEDALIGVMFETAFVDDDIVIDDPSHWVFEGTGVNKGDRLRGLLGPEVDRMFGNSPPGTHRLAHSVATNRLGQLHYADMTIYTHPSGSIVFATGTIQWSWGLDDFRHPGRLNLAAQQVTRNVLKRFVAQRP